MSQMESADYVASVIQSEYGSRAADYDQSEFHRRLAADFAKWSELWLQPGATVLDLACGTGMVALAAKRQSPHLKEVIGVDVTLEMLDVARRNAETEGLAEGMAWIKADITRLHDVPSLQSRTFDAIFCCSAFVLLQNRVSTLRSWVKLLQTTGVLIIDFPAAHSQWLNKTISRIFEEAGRAPLFSQSWVTGEGAIRELVEKAGLGVQSIFTTANAYHTRAWAKNEGGKVFDEIVQHPLFDPVNGLKSDQDFMVEARARFVREWESRADSSGTVKDIYDFIVVLANLPPA